MARREVADVLRQATAGLPAAEVRPSQLQMAEAVASAIARRRHLIVQAGTGTGKSLGYLVPALALGARVVVSTATKALQDQLRTRDLPRLVNALGLQVDFAVLKGRSNYICLQRVAEITAGGDQPRLDLEAGHAEELGPLGREVRRLVAWAATTETGDRAELPWEPSASAWAQVSVGAADCPGAARCPAGPACLAERARARAGVADVIVVNTHLYATHLAAGGEVLPPHDLVVFDEAHELEDIVTASFGFELTAGRVQALARVARPFLGDPSPAERVGEAATLLQAALSTHRGALRRPLEEDLQTCLLSVRERVASLLAQARQATAEQRTAQGTADQPPARVGDRASTRGSPPPTRVGDREPAGGSLPVARALRVQLSATTLIEQLDQVLQLDATKVAWVEGPEHAPVLRVAPVEVGPLLSKRLWKAEAAPTAVLTSATVPPRLAERIGLESGSFDELDVGSPFAYSEQALLYCALHLPDPRRPGYEPAMWEELAALIHAAGGRTLALFTSWKAMRAAAEAVAPRVPWPVLTQADLPKPALLERFSSEEHTCLFATMGFWQGVDVPGPTLSVVAIDRLPFPRPDDPLLQARRERLGPAAFGLIDIPRAATLLAQGTGRLIRGREDRGVVAVLDSRLGRASYRWDLIRALPPMRRTRHRAEVEAFLAPLREKDAGAAAPARPDRPA